MMCQQHSDYAADISNELLDNVDLTLCYVVGFFFLSVSLICGRSQTRLSHIQVRLHNHTKEKATFHLALNMAPRQSEVPLMYTLLPFHLCQAKPLTADLCDRFW